MLESYCWLNSLNILKVLVCYNSLLTFYRITYYLLPSLSSCCRVATLSIIREQINGLLLEEAHIRMALSA